MLCHSVRSCHWPSLSLNRSFVANENLATGVPLGVYLSSGSLPRFPIRITLLTLFPAMIAAPCASRREAYRELRAGRQSYQKRMTLWPQRATQSQSPGRNETGQWLMLTPEIAAPDGRIAGFS